MLTFVLDTATTKSLLTYLLPIIRLDIRFIEGIPTTPETCKIF